MDADRMTRFGRWRAENEFTFEELADLTGLSASVLCRVANGRRRLKPETTHGAGGI